MAEQTIAPPGLGVKAKSYGRTSWRFLKRNSLAVYVTILSIILAMMVLAPSIFITVPAGHVGVLWLRFFGGTVTDRYYGEGMHMIFPWDEMAIYDTRLQNTARMYDTISSNGLSMQVEIAVRYRLDRDSAGLMHKLVGPNYPEVLVYPEIGSHARELIARYTPEQLYTETRAFIQSQILERMVTQLGSSLVSQNVRGKMLHIEDVLIRSIRLPDRVAEAIESKAEQQQIMLEYEFRLAREEKERDRKRIEAEGVRDFQAIVARSITNEYLRLRGIEATMALATSNNSKMIIIGGKDGLPVILNTADTPGDTAAKGLLPQPKPQSSSVGAAKPDTGMGPETSNRKGPEIPKQRDTPIPATPARKAPVAPPGPVPVKD
jgi:regulator of protease activity HflC (stomatin/prohibitin superfamily)